MASESASSSSGQSVRLMSVDAYRGFVMLAMASAGMGFATVARNPDVMNRFQGTDSDGAWQFLWRTLSYQFSHVDWTGCSFWDLIQPSFMFLVGVAVPFSTARRHASGESELQSFLHAAWRAFVLIAMGVLLSSSVKAGVVHFTFVNVLAQIGLGYLFLYLLQHRTMKTLAATAAAILIGYGAWFGLQPIDPADEAVTRQYVHEVLKLDEAEYSQFNGWAAHWNKHTNAAAQLDRTVLNWFPRLEPDWNGRKFVVNNGGYQTLNFIPSLATMIFGLMAGLVLKSDRTDGERLKWLFKAGLLCFVISMGCDTTIWPTQWLSPEWQAKIYEHSWSVCPVVKRIWTPTWAVFSSGWTFWLLGLFYWAVDVRGWRTPAFPLAVVGLNSIAIYCIAQLFRGWIGDALRFVLRTMEQMAGWNTFLTRWLDSDAFAYAPIIDASARLAIMWLICLWMYRRSIYVRV